MKLNLGCGKKFLPDYVNVDKKDFDFDIFPYPLKDNSFDYVHCHHVLEHLKYPQEVISELYRICKDGAVIHIEVPYWNSKNSANDLTHLHRFNERTFEILLGINHSYKDDAFLAYHGNACGQIHKFRIIKTRFIPTSVWKYFPFKNKIKDYICNVISNISVDVRVNKGDLL